MKTRALFQGGISRGRRLQRDGIPFAMLGVSFLGFSLFYLFPFLFSSFYCLIDNPVRRKFVGIRNFVDLFNNPFFLRGLGNTALFMALCVPLNMALSLAAALLVNAGVRRSRLFSLVFLAPLVMPSVVTAFFWQNIFGERGICNKCLSCLGMAGQDWLQGRYGVAVMALIFLWKNIGYNMVLYVSGLSSIPKEYYECAAVEGAGKLWQFRKITLVYLAPTAFLALIMSFVNSFKVFKEIYIITGQYPPEGMYVLQHYMNNMFLELNYARLTSAVYVLTAVIVLFVACIFRAERKVSESLEV